MRRSSAIKALQPAQRVHEGRQDRLRLAVPAEMIEFPLAERHRRPGLASDFSDLLGERIPTADGTGDTVVSTLRTRRRGRCKLENNRQKVNLTGSPK